MPADGFNQVPNVQQWHKGAEGARVVSCNSLLGAAAKLFLLQLVLGAVRGAHCEVFFQDSEPCKAGKWGLPQCLMIYKVRSFQIASKMLLAELIPLVCFYSLGVFLSFTHL